MHYLLVWTFLAQVFINSCLVAILAVFLVSQLFPKWQIGLLQDKLANKVMSRPNMYLVGFGFMCFTFGLAQEIPDVGHNFPVHIGAKDHIVQGRISSRAKPGQLVPRSSVAEGEEEADTRLHLRVEVRHSQYQRPHLYHTGNCSHSDADSPKGESIIVQFPNNSLPSGMEFVVQRTDAFYVNEDRYVVVRDLSQLNGQARVHFEVVLRDTLAGDIFVSNHLPFLVDIEYATSGGNPDALLFTGMLVLAILVFSFVVPFAVRAKRRRKAGKPICGFGSAEAACDREFVDFGETKSNCVSGTDNLAMLFEKGTLRSSVAPNRTIQNRYLQTTSSISLQPHSLDPHFKDVYDRPQFSQFQLRQSQKRHQGELNGNSPVGSSGSDSSNGGGSYPINFHTLSGRGKVEKVHSVLGLSNGVLSNRDASLETVARATRANGDVSVVEKVQVPACTTRL
ncbi:hypothetical protein BsWGS_26031 [Bradybaena similaris]